MKPVRNAIPKLRPIAALIIMSYAAASMAQQAPEQTLAPVIVKEAPSAADRVQSPATTESVTRERINDTTNVMNAEDSFKYLPSVLIRKRHIGDTQAPMTTRTSGLGASARSLIFADGMLLSALIANDNNNGGPKFGMVNPEEIERIDLMYGPFSAAYAGNSIGAVAEITTRMPERFEATAKFSENWQSYKQYSTNETYVSKQASALLGNKIGDLSFWLGANHLDSHSQPLQYVTTPVRPAAAAGTAVSGAVLDANRNGNAIFVLGEGGLEHHIQDNFKIKVAYDFTPTLRATYMGGMFHNNTTSSIKTFLTDAAGRPFYGAGGVINQGGFNSSNAAQTANANVANNVFGSGMYKFREEHTMHNFSLKSNTRAVWDWEAAVTRYNYGQSERRTPTGAMPNAMGGGAGTILDMAGTGWGAADVKGFWRPEGLSGAHSVSFGGHYDRSILDQPTWNTTDWLSGGKTTLNSDSRGKTETRALWLQDVWKFAPGWKATLGGRIERWRAFEGRNLTAGLNAVQPSLSAAGFSPKASVSWEVNNNWLLTGSVGRAYRFPTVIELYKSATVGGITSFPNPNLQPEHALSSELAIERNLADGRLRVSLFQEYVRDALISQSTVLPGGVANTVVNVDQTRGRGVEAVYQQNNVFMRGLELMGSVTYSDTRVTANTAYPTAVGKLLPSVPLWRATATATYRPSDQLAASLAVRYQGKMYGSIENWDGYPHTYQGFEGFLVADVRLRYKLDKNWTAAVGIDNLNNRNYFLFHPFPQRSLSAELKYTY